MKVFRDILTMSKRTGEQKMEIKNEVIQPDGSGYTALAYVRGVLFVVSYVGNRLTVKLGPYKNAPRRPRWYQESVQAWAEKRIKELPPEFFAAHQELYGVPA